MLDFLAAIRLELRQIAARTKGEVSADDLENEAYLLLVEFEDKNNRALTLDEKSWVMGRITNKYVKWFDYKFRNSLRLGSLEDEEEHGLIMDLPAPATSNPLVGILEKEELVEHQKLLKNSYSEAKAYVISFSRFNYDKVLLSNYFLITTNTLSKRFERAIWLLVNQPSIFDAIEVIDETFIPKPGQEKLRLINTLLKDQLSLELG